MGPVSKLPVRFAVAAPWRAGMAVAVLLVGLTGVSSAITSTVDSTADRVDANPGDGICDDGTGSCTLRAAVQESNAIPPDLPGADIVVPAGRYVLTIPGDGENEAASGDLDLINIASLSGAGADVTIVDGGGAAAVLSVERPDGVGPISDMALTNARVGVRSGFELPVLLERVAITGNQWAGVAAGGRTEIADSVISDNGGPGISNGSYLGLLTVVRSVIRGNRETGIVGGQYVGVEDCLIEDNVSPGDGGGIYAPVALSVSRSRIVNNRAGGSGGGIYSEYQNSSLYGAGTSVGDTVISGNHASLDGGGISSPGLQAVRLTLDGNTAGRNGGKRPMKLSITHKLRHAKPEFDIGESG